MMHLTIGIAALAAAVLQAAPPSQPTFRSGVELVRVDVTVVDSNGRPVRDLQSSDFVVRIDGKPREVRFARFYGPEDGSAAGWTASPPAPALPAAGIATNAGARAGRIVVFVVDRESIRPGHEKPLLETASRLIGRLSPQDAVALVGIPGPTVDLTRDRGRVMDALKLISGTQPKPLWRWNLTLSEAQAWEKRDGRRIGFVIERECPVFRGSTNTCPQELRIQAFEMLQTARQQARNVVLTLSGLADSLREADHPKQLILLSGGMSFDLDTLTWYREFARKAAAARITMYAIHVDQPPFDASDGGNAIASVFGGRDMAEGLTTVAGLTGGAYFSGIGSGKGIFERLLVELDNVYQLGVDGLPGDADGRPHEIRVEVRRPGVTVRARREVIVPPAPAGQNRLAAVLRQPVDVTDLPVAAGVHVARGEQPDTLKVILVGEAGQGTGARLPIDYGFVVVRDGKPTHEIVDRFAARPARAVTAVQLAPGAYRLRFGAVDGDGRGGSLELPFRVGLRAAGDLQFSDLLVGPTQGGFAPAVAVDAGAPLAAMLELYTTKPDLFAETRVALEVHAAADERLVARVEAALHATGADRRQVAEGTLPSDLAPGRYQVSAIVNVAGTPAGKVTRGLLIAAAP